MRLLIFRTLSSSKRMSAQDLEVRQMSEGGGRQVGQAVVREVQCGERRGREQLERPRLERFEPVRVQTQRSQVRQRRRRRRRARSAARARGRRLQHDGQRARRQPRECVPAEDSARKRSSEVGTESVTIIDELFGVL